MSMTSDIAQSWRAHRLVVRRHLNRPKSEPLLFVFLFVFLLLTFLARYPTAARVALENPAAPLAPQLLAIAMGLLATIPFFYALAALSNVGARVFGVQGTWYGARLALFWSLVAASPLVLLQGLTGAILGAGRQETLVGIAALVAFLVFWGLALIEVSSAQTTPNTNGGDDDL